MADDKHDISVIIGRFQVHQLHEAHCDIIETVMKDHKKTILFLGVKPVLGSTSNPLDFVSRKIMLQEKYPELIILALPDSRDDGIWSKSVDDRIREVFPRGSAVLYGSRDSFIPYYKGQFDTKELEQKVYVSGTEVRKQVSEEIKSSSEWRSGVIFGCYNRYPISFQMVDVAVFNEKETEILLVKRINEPKYRFIGGFVKPTDISLEHTATRQFMEKAQAEIGITSYIGSFRIDDWRYRSERDKIMTTLFRAKYACGHLSPSEDVQELKWFTIEEISSDIDKIIIEEYQPMMSTLLTKLNTDSKK